MKRKKKTYLVFLGAGASIPLGFPGSAKLVDEFIDELRTSQEPDKKALLRRIARLREVIASNGFDYDSESLYSCLEGYSAPTKWMHRSGPFPCSLCKMQPVLKIKSDQLCVKLSSLFEEFLITKYYREDPFLKLRIRSLYDRFFAKISGVRAWKKRGPDWTSSDFEIFTTNFDRVLEIYSDHVNKKMCVGYRLAKDNRVVFTPDEYEVTTAPLRLYKLHGSVELSLLEDNTIISQLPPTLPGQNYGRKRIVSKVMVYGIEKNIISEPYFELLSIFKKRLMETRKCFVVGYSFRDPWINQILLDVIKNYPNTIKIQLIGIKKHTKIPSIPALNKVVTPLSSKIEVFLDL